MTQEEVYKYLKKKKRWVDSKELARVLGISRRSAQTALRRMSKYENKLEKKRAPGQFSIYLWRIK